ncbi:MAG: hypothetical protein GX654_02280 [Desulfatiglans sp.]|nr:hypothetical protein [Desulfatiglans sp.]
MKKILVGLIILAFSSYLYADGGEIRPATKAEKVFTRAVIETISGAVPESFAGFDRRDATEPYEPEDMGVGIEKWPLNVGFYGSWVNDELELEANEKMQQIADTVTGDISTSPKMQTLMKKKDEIAAKMEQAAKKNDLDAIGRLAQELEAVAKEINKGYAPAVNATPSEDYYKVHAGIQVNALTDEYSESLVKEISPVKGYKTFYYHDTEEGENKRTDRVIIFMGDWSSSIDNGAYIFKLNKKNLPHTTVQSYVITVEGKKEYTQKLIASLNWEKLKSILK